MKSLLSGVLHLWITEIRADAIGGAVDQRWLQLRPHTLAELAHFRPELVGVVEMLV